MRNWCWTRDNFIKPAGGISRRQKNLAKTAVLWLLHCGPHTQEEIAEHFGLAGPVVASLLAELTAAQEVIRSPEKKYVPRGEAALAAIQPGERGNRSAEYRFVGDKRGRGRRYHEQAGSLERPE
ncbi:MAG TPA: hypothetical protein VMW83_03630 [Spirochaetia bacterium]|nr:hypothetical protein [Spirochaetia bacterium]